MALMIGRVELDASRLWHDHPPQLRHPQKQALLDLAGGLERTARGTLVVTRWAPSDLGPVGPTTTSTGIDGAFRYPRPEVGVHAWHVNFADMVVSEGDRRMKLEESPWRCADLLGRGVGLAQVIEELLAALVIEPTNLRQ